MQVAGPLHRFNNTISQERQLSKRVKKIYFLAFKFLILYVRLFLFEVLVFADMSCVVVKHDQFEIFQIPCNDRTNCDI